MDKDVVKATKKIALIPGIGIGDSLLFVPSIYDLLQQGYELEIFSTPLQALLPLDPRIVFSKTYDFQSDPLTYLDKLKTCAKVFIQIDSPGLALAEHLPTVIVGKRKSEDLPQGLQIECDICKTLKIRQEPLKAMREWLLCAPSSKKTEKRRTLAIHPSSSHPSKNWSLQGFLKVAHAFTEEGYRVVFCLGPQEQELAQALAGQFELWQGLSLPTLAQKLSHCEFFIGTDSGLGHLASLVGTPTVSIFQSKRHSLLWRPCWHHQVCVLPWIPLPRYFRHRVWKACVLSFQVIRKARQLLEKTHVRTSS